MESAKNACVLVGRILLCFIFLSSGFMKITHWAGTAAYMASKGMPAVSVFLALAIAVEILGALSVYSGLLARLGALALIVYLIPVTLVFHNFWALGGMDRQLQLIMFMKNTCIVGGLLLVVGFGAGRYSLDAWLAGRR